MNKIVCGVLFFVLSQTPLAQVPVKDFQNLMASKQYSKLEKELKYQLKFFPNDNQLLELLGDVYGYQNSWEKASECYQKLVENFSKNANYHYKYGGVLGRMAKESSKLKALALIRKVKDLFKKAQALDPNHLLVHWAQVQLYAELPGFLGGSYKTSWSHADQLEILSPIDGYLAKLFILEHQNRKELAKLYAKKIVLHHNEITCLKTTNIVTSNCINFDNSLNFGVGYAYLLSNNDLDTAEFFIKKYILNYSSRDRTPIEKAHLELAKLYLKKNQREKALKQLNIALEVNSDLDEAIQIQRKILKEIIKD